MKLQTQIYSATVQHGFIFTSAGIKLTIDDDVTVCERYPLSPMAQNLTKHTIYPCDVTILHLIVISQPHVHRPTFDKLDQKAT